MEDLGGRQQGVSGFGSASCGPVGKQLTVIDVHPSILRFSCLGLLQPPTHQDLDDFPET